MYTHNPVHSRCLFRGRYQQGFPISLTALQQHISDPSVQNYSVIATQSLLREAFTRTGLLSPFAFCDEFSTVRLQHNRAITELMKAASQQILNGELGNREPHAIGEREVHLEAQTSRYLNEFDEVARLGKGGYGKVYKVRNKLDGKTIMELLPLSLEQESSNDHCQIQSVESGSSIIFADLTSQDKKSCDSLRNLGGESVQNMDEKNGFTDSNDKENVKPNKCEFSIELPEDSVSDVSSVSTDVENDSAQEPHSSSDQDGSTESKSCTEECSRNDVALCGDFGVEYHLMLYIQMQLCELSLWDWIVDRNKRCNNRTEEQSSPYQLVDVSWTMKIFQELVEGVCYIHSMGVMHRDIKSDMYSMGVILLELFQPFGTEMERMEVLTHLRNGQIPHTFYKQWPTQAKYVKLLTSQSSTERPTAAQLRDSELFHTTEHVISNLQQKVRQQEEEIEKLRERIRVLSEEQEENMRLGSPV
ncbi:eukaryotic translation initiation factor 2-alpha kinase 1 isoform X1 [Willisornis vidua]|uniref:Eukaryotic translation initiation factor 2-alpha kinase 1 n=1 Tax=Willisornis vidua TaxID=1566151 RepID=A0ABQ9CWW5_9PASS|nr:eukaryotic translation initiation factor 2-alpha kinase 1 isoform X1 [Willisornis vidua]